MGKSEGETPHPKGHHEDDKAHKRERIAQGSSYALQIVGMLLLLVAWAGDGKRWSYIEVGDFKLGGRGFCDG